MNLPIFLLGAMWGGLYLVQVQGLSRADASVVTSMIFVGTIIGSTLLGWLSDRLARRRSPMLIGAALSLGLVFNLMYTPQLGFFNLAALFFLLGLLTSTQVISYPLIVESNPVSLTGSAEGLASVLIMSGGFAQPLFGWLMGRNWAHTMVNNMPVYSHADYLSAMWIMPVAFGLSLLAATVIKETYCQPLKQPAEQADLDSDLNSMEAV